ncbi:MAG: aspartate dehydrogenase [Pusillimonas sp.]|jgi:aspartate dehydrogenase|nr:aspartate dehydrogenase [Pusillimonas sp.]|tara:strand:- start:5909 stop:6724 length:816 start_codon:yes stop_codon:yes gene_type:complete
MTVERIALVGFGAIGRAVFDLIADDNRLEIDQIVVPAELVQPIKEELAQRPNAASVTVSDHVSYDDRPDLIVECAGHSAIETHVLPGLKAGIPCMVVSIGALSAPGLPEQLEAAAQAGDTQVHLLSGAIGGIDALAAARVAGLDEVTYVGRKPPLGWLGTPAEEKLDLHNLKEKAIFFEGSARDAARLFPKNANVAATLSLAGIGLDKTKVKLYADPTVSENIHYYEAQGAFGFMGVTLKGKPLASNPKTSALTVYSVVRALKNRVQPVAV